MNYNIQFEQLKRKLLIHKRKIKICLVTYEKLGPKIIYLPISDNLKNSKKYILA